ncbi:hypothetical protein E2C01_044431 [Portunus trituberculatus]|uniref:Uncharacterized protein n=1 Tax=Portunus trituberculatus TaxID=210409 RepID=A0A5B7FVL4_PORTR|nr:hypothetical protein [Portunus trituberculatus]
MLYMSLPPDNFSTTCTVERVASIEMCKPEGCSLEEDDLFLSTETSTLDIGSSGQDVIHIMIRTGTSNSKDTLSLSSPTPSPASSSPTPAPVQGNSTQPSPGASPGPKRTPTRKRKRDNNEPASTDTLKIVGAMTNAISNLNTFSFATLVEKTCEKLPLLSHLWSLSTQ